jgi:NADPH:quinone reductase-like Zn-dependent oxidoreductase
MQAIRLHGPGVDGLRHETIETPSPRPGDVLVEVHAAAITREELDWPLDRLRAVPSYELSGVIAAADLGLPTPCQRCSRHMGIMVCHAGRTEAQST